MPTKEQSTFKSAALAAEVAFEWLVAQHAIVPPIAMSLQAQPQLGECGPIDVKLVLVGPAFAGKTELLRRFCCNTFRGDRGQVTIVGERKVVREFGGKVFNISIFDTAGQEAWSELANSYLRGADGILLVVGAEQMHEYIHSEPSLDKRAPHLSKQLARLGSLFGNEQPPVASFYNKTDLDDYSAASRDYLANREEADLWAFVKQRAHKAATPRSRQDLLDAALRVTQTGRSEDGKQFWGSAKEGYGVNEAFEYIIGQAVAFKVNMLQQRWSSVDLGDGGPPSSEVIRLEQPSTPSTGRCACGSARAAA
jgi:GTPase SAR1 family protein